MAVAKDELLLVTGATGLVGSHVVETTLRQGWRVRALVRASADRSLLEKWDVETCIGDLSDTDSLRNAVQDASVIVHCAAKVGDWGPVEAYRRINVDGLRDLIRMACEAGRLRRFVHISSLGVYPARDHYGSDEAIAPAVDGIDGYTRTKVEAERLVEEKMVNDDLPAVILRPGFIYGPRDRTVLPRILERLRDDRFAFLGSTQKLMNNTYVGNLCDAIILAICRDDVVGRKFNIRDGRLVSKEEFIGTIARLAGYPVPTKVVPLPIARALAKSLEALWRLLGKQESPILSMARIKFLGLHLDYSIDKARRELGYEPAVDFSQGMEATVRWFQEQNQI